MSLILLFQLAVLICVLLMGGLIVFYFIALTKPINEKKESGLNNKNIDNDDDPIRKV